MNVGRSVIPAIPSGPSSAVPATVIKPYAPAVDSIVASSAAGTYTTCRTELNSSQRKEP
jgi:hypothetical protein